MTKMKKKKPEPRASEDIRDASGRIKPGHSGNPGGVSKHKRDFLKRLQDEDADEIYAAFMTLVRDGEVSVVIRAMEYIAGKPKSADADLEAMARGRSGLDEVATDDIIAALRAGEMKGSTT